MEHGGKRCPLPNGGMVKVQQASGKITTGKVEPEGYHTDLSKTEFSFWVWPSIPAGMEHEAIIRFALPANRHVDLMRIRAMALDFVRPENLKVDGGVGT